MTRLRELALVTAGVCLVVVMACVCPEWHEEV